MLLREAVHVVRETQALADVEEQTRAHAFAEHRVQEIEHVTIGMHVAQSAHAEADVSLLGLLLAQYQVRSAQITWRDRKSTRLNSSHPSISYAVFCLKKK